MYSGHSDIGFARLRVSTSLLCSENNRTSAMSFLVNNT